MKRRVLGLLLALCLVIGMLPMAVLAEDAGAGTGAATTKPVLTFSYPVAADHQKANKAEEIAMNAGDATKYWTTGAYNTAFPDSKMMKAGTETDFSVKLEYPADGTPVLTLKNAELHGELLLIAKNGKDEKTFDGAVKVVLEGENKGGFNIRFNAKEATVAGPGSMTTNRQVYGFGSTGCGILHNSNGNLILDNATIRMDLEPNKSEAAAHGVGTIGGDIIIKGGSLKIVGYNPFSAGDEENNWSQKRPILSAICSRKSGDVGGNTTIEGGAKVSVIASSLNRYGCQSSIWVDGKLTFKNAEVEWAVLGGTYLPLFAQGKLGGFAAEYTDGYTVYWASSGGKYDQATDTYTAPKASLIKSANDISKAPVGGKYFKIKAGVDKVETGSGSGTGTGTGTGTGSGTGTGTNGSAATGDISILMTAGLAMASAVSFAGVAVIRKKRS